jgi:SPP1 gp7 family putative phage head morphogenesis protein
MGFTGNEINEKLKLGFEPKEWRDKWWIPFSTVPAGETLQQNPDPQEDAPQKSKTVSDLVIWKAFLKKHEPLENRFESKLKRYFFEQRKEALASMSGEKSAQKHIQITIDWLKQDEKLIGLAKTYLYESILEGVDFSREFAGQQIVMDRINHRISSLLEDKTRKITRVNATIRGQLETRVNEALEAGAAQGQTMQQISETVKDSVRGIYNLANTRARAIARTEITGAMNGGQLLYYAEIGAPYKQWVTAGDEAVRESHRILEGEMVGVHQRFGNGLDAPGGDGPAEEVINCRCTLIPIFKKE